MLAPSFQAGYAKSQPLSAIKMYKCHHEGEAKTLWRKGSEREVHKQISAPLDIHPLLRTGVRETHLGTFCTVNMAPTQGAGVRKRHREISVQLNETFTQKIRVRKIH